MGRTDQRFDGTGDKEMFQLPNQIDNYESMLKKKLADDVAKFNNFQSKRWQDLQEKLDSVHVSRVI